MSKSPAAAEHRQRRQQFYPGLGTTARTLVFGDSAPPTKNSIAMSASPLTRPCPNLLHGCYVNNSRDTRVSMDFIVRRIPRANRL